ncbi:nucleotidyltransferase domain-containing protein [Candidatus Woesearchaeota archaeon]|nr:nucleotidyltransferase domain-containing protein [Candidatus Woesearchaeota archaeon]
MKKDELVLDLFFNEPTKHWHFEEILTAVKISRPQAAGWLRKFVKEGLVRRIKPKGKMPYHVGNYESSTYQARKRLFALNKLEKQGFLSHLTSLPKAQAVIMFGSMSRWDWNKESDIDLFVYGDPEGFDKGAFRAKLGREIETFVCKDKEDLQRLKPALLRNILEGYLIKGTLNFVQVAHA